MTALDAWRLAQEAASALRELAPDASRRDPLLYERLLELADEIQETYRNVGEEDNS